MLLPPNAEFLRDKVKRKRQYEKINHDTIEIPVLSKLTITDSAFFADLLVLTTSLWSITIKVLLFAISSSVLRAK